MEVALSILFTLLLTIANGYFSMSEAALVAAKRAVLEHDADEGDKRAKVALELSGDSGQFLAAIQVAITLVGFFSAMVASTTLSDPLAAWLISLGAPAGVCNALAPIVITVIVSYVSIVVGELVPKRMALANAEEVSKSVSPFLRGFSHVVAPLVWLTSKSADGLSRLLGVKSADDRQEVSEEEIRYMVTDADELSDKEKSMIHEIFDLGDAIAREVMVPRVDLTAVEDTETLGEVLALMRRTGFSRIPVLHEDIVEEVVGEIADEFDPDNKYLTRLSDREWLVDGRFSIDDARDLGWPIEDSEEYETVAGFILELADSVPSPGDSFDVEGYNFLVQSMRGRRIALLRVTAPEPPAPAGEDETPGE